MEVDAKEEDPAKRTSAGELHQKVQHKGIPWHLRVDKSDNVRFSWSPLLPPAAMFHQEDALALEDKDGLLVHVSAPPQRYFDAGTSAMASIVRMWLGMSLDRCRLLPRLTWGCTGFPRFAHVDALFVAAIVFCSSSAVISITSDFFLDHTYYEVLGSPVEKIGCGDDYPQAVSLRGLVSNCTGCLVYRWMMPSITGEVPGLLAIMYGNINTLRSDLFIGRYGPPPSDSAVLQGLVHVLQIAVELCFAIYLTDEGSIGGRSLAADGSFSASVFTLTIYSPSLVHPGRPVDCNDQVARSPMSTMVYFSEGRARTPGPGGYNGVVAICQKTIVQ
ncbi:hypothetical protein FOZ63_028017, partial [Perkinsus olseni]